ncbi:hypothetical protein KUCAC02_005390, partial [Chaenocephalus aceratus]
DSKAERERDRDGVLLFVSHAAKVKSQTETYIVDDPHQSPDPSFGTTGFKPSLSAGSMLL